MLRYLRTLWLFWSTALYAEMEYRANFLLSSVTSLMMLIGSVYALHLFYRVGYQPGGWTWAEALLVLGFYNILDGFSDCVLRPNLGRIVQHVREGTLDFILLKPIDHQFWLSLRNTTPWGLPTIGFGVALVIYGGATRQPPLALGDYLIGLAPTMLGLVVLYSIWFMLGTLTIWFVKLYNVTEALRSVLEAGKFPIGAYHGVWRVAFTFVIPVAFMTTVPAQVMLARGSTGWLIAAAGLALGLFIASRLFFRFALRYYTSASS